eukprot:TRINITY_DN5961_c0_g1_i1.p1 TRINITY_DN5961_c0_g1~~TRINITY_DN5961_c0_g1_i1.p1  ORF type:complete len:857 (-),score=220.02 TRINITY_DN5961_c0_g1_i1:32-2512(-)
MEYLEVIAQEIQPLKKRLAWSWVYEVDKQIQKQNVRLEKLQSRVSSCQGRIDKSQDRIHELEREKQGKQAISSVLMGRTEEIRKNQDELQQRLTQASREKVEAEEELRRRKDDINRMYDRIHFLQKQILDIQERHVKMSQAEEHEREEKFKNLEQEIDLVNSRLQSFKEEERVLDSRIKSTTEDARAISSELEGNRSKYHDIQKHIDKFRRQQVNKVTAFGGEKVLSLLRVIESRYRQFSKPPIGPIGAHVTLVDNQAWALAIEHAIGKLLNAFIVTNHKDALLLRQCARESSYSNLQIIIYDFDRPALNIPERMLPDRSLRTVMSAIHAEIPTVANVLVDQGNMERQVLVKDYEAGKSIAFEKKFPNIKEVFTMDGYKLFARGFVQTTLPPDNRIRGGRLCAAIEETIAELENEASKISDLIRMKENQKFQVDATMRNLRENLQSTKRQVVELERHVMSKKITLQHLKNSVEVESNSDFGPNVDELEQEIAKIQSEIQMKEDSLEKLKIRLMQAQQKANDCRAVLEEFCGSAKGDIEALGATEQELVVIEDALNTSILEKKHYEDLMNMKVMPEIEEVKKEIHNLQAMREENCKKASVICTESEVDALGGCKDSSPEQLSAQLKRLSQRLQTENEKHPESIDDLRRKYNKRERKISKKRHGYELLRQKLNACREALELRHTKFQRNATLLKRQLTWQFNGHLIKKGISGHIKVNYGEERLFIEVKMPQDESSSAVRDTRGLSGGERSFSTLCFALALHEMTEAPFRAMDEFDVFMDAVSRKISLDTVVDFAIAQGSQWIFITPHDISMIKSGPNVKKQQMPAPRP